MKITPDMVVAVPRDGSCKGCIAVGAERMCKSLPSCEDVIYKLKPEYEQSSKSQLKRIAVQRGESPSENARLQARITELEAELEAELAKYKEQEP